MREKEIERKRKKRANTNDLEKLEIAAKPHARVMG